MRKNENASALDVDGDDLFVLLPENSILSQTFHPFCFVAFLVFFSFLENELNLPKKGVALGGRKSSLSFVSEVQLTLDIFIGFVVLLNVPQRMCAFSFALTFIQLSARKKGWNNRTSSFSLGFFLFVCLFFLVTHAM